MGDAPIGSELVRVLETSWAAIRSRHSDVPAAVMITGAGSGGRRGGLRLAHFAASRWQLSSRQRVAELFVGGEGLKRGGADVPGTQLHDAAHGLAHAREIKDASRQGRYHNRRFRQLAEEVGLDVQHHAQLGWSLTSLPQRTAILYGGVIHELEERVLTIHRQREQPLATGTVGGRSLACTCGVSGGFGWRRACWPRVRFVCGICGEPFEPVCFFDAQSSTLRHEAYEESS
jgi:hypothetical protein